MRIYIVLSTQCKGILFNFILKILSHCVDKKKYRSLFNFQKLTLEISPKDIFLSMKIALNKKTAIIYILLYFDFLYDKMAL